jgi:hypothetical protein
MIHFGLAYQLQQKLDDSFFAMIDTPNNPKKMFLSQKIVNFEKTWFFHDHIKKSIEKPDLEYLANFEKKYHINLWKLAINERHFYKFNRFYKFTTNEILKFLEQECKLFEHVLDEIKPDYFLTNEPPFHHQKLMMELCKAKGIKVLCLTMSRFEGSSIIVENNATFDLPPNLDLVELNESKVEHKKNNFNKSNMKWANNKKSSALDKLKALKDYILFSDSKNVESNFTYYGRKKHSVIFDTLSFYIKRQKRYHYLENNSMKVVDLSVPFAYFPLGIDDDIALLHYAPLFTNQIEVIRHIAKSLPIDHRLFVKDHIHSVFRGWKDIKQYKEIKDIPNVTLIHPSYSSKELIKNSNIVITIRGSSSLEAAYENKPSLIFDDMPHDILPSVYKVRILEELPKLIRIALDTQVNPSDIKKYDKLMNERKVDFDWSNYELLRNNQFYSGNILSDMEYPENKVEEFFENNKKIFQTLSNAHIEKINSY